MFQETWHARTSQVFYIKESGLEASHYQNSAGYTSAHSQKNKLFSCLYFSDRWNPHEQLNVIASTEGLETANPHGFILDCFAWGREMYISRKHSTTKCCLWRVESWRAAVAEHVPLPASLYYRCIVWFSSTTVNVSTQDKSILISYLTSYSSTISSTASSIARL